MLQCPVGSRSVGRPRSSAKDAVLRCGMAGRRLGVRVARHRRGAQGGFSTNGRNMPRTVGVWSGTRHCHGGGIGGRGYLVASADSGRATTLPTQGPLGHGLQTPSAAMQYRRLPAEPANRKTGRRAGAYAPGLDGLAMSLLDDLDPNSRLGPVADLWNASVGEKLASFRCGAGRPKRRRSHSLAVRTVLAGVVWGPGREQDVTNLQR